MDRPSVVETPARTAACAAAAAEVILRGKGREVHLGLVSVVVGASVASVDGVVASVAMARGRAETLVGGARVVAQGGCAARAR